MIYPDSDDTIVLGDGGDGQYDRVGYQYNRQGQQKQIKDQNQTVHDYLFDLLGRQTADIVSDYDADLIDPGVLRIDRSYEARGMIEKITSYDDADLQQAAVVD